MVVVLLDDVLQLWHGVPRSQPGLAFAGCLYRHTHMCCDLREAGPAQVERCVGRLHWRPLQPLELRA
jgi:hypothetical protein